MSMRTGKGEVRGAFTDLDPLGRTVIVIVAALTLAVAATAFATSYGALYAYARDSGLYSERLARIWPLLLDGAFIVAQLASVLAGILRGSRGWPVLTMLTCGSLTVWFNIQHAGVDPGRRLAAVIPPVLMILAFEIDISIVKWALRTLSQLPLDHRPPGNDAHWSPTGRAEHNEVAVGGRDAEPPGRADGPA